MIHARNILLAIATAAALAACTQVVLLEPGRTEIDGVYTVETAIAWNKISGLEGEVWTLDGPALNHVGFYTRIRDGENIYRKAGTEDGPDAKYKNMPTFRKGMTPPELSELLVATFVQSGNTDVETTRLDIADFGGHPGFAMEMSFKTENGLDMRTLALGATVGDRLHLVVYTAAAIYYYERDRERVESIMNSIEFLGA